MDTTEIIKNALDWADKRLELTDQKLTDEQRNYITFALRQNLVNILPIQNVSKRFEIDQKVIWDGMYYWVLEINIEVRKVLLANDRNQDHPQSNDWWVNIEEVNAC